MMYPARLKSIYKFVMKLLGTCYTRGNDAQASCRDDLLSVFQLAIPIFHCYGHKLKCQVCTLMMRLMCMQVDMQVDKTYVQPSSYGIINKS